MKILVADCNLDRDSWGAPELRRELGLAAAIVASPMDLWVRRAPERDLPDARGFVELGLAGLVVSGSRMSCLATDAWLEELVALIRTLVESEVPVLGVCFGHQLLARALAGPQVLGASATPEYGWTRLERMAAGSGDFLGATPERFWAYSSHREEVREAPAGTEVLARSEACAIQALQVRGRAAFGVQFHPERGRGEAQFDPTLIGSVLGSFLTHARERDQRGGHA